MGKFSGGIESSDHNKTEVNGYLRQRKLILEQMEPWRQLSQDATGQPPLSMTN